MYVGVIKKAGRNLSVAARLFDERIIYFSCYLLMESTALVIITKSPLLAMHLRRKYSCREQDYSLAS